VVLTAVLQLFVESQEASKSSARLAPRVQPSAKARQVLHETYNRYLPPFLPVAA
jgi:hypothetical protein